MNSFTWSRQPPRCNRPQVLRKAHWPTGQTLPREDGVKGRRDQYLATMGRSGTTSAIMIRTTLRNWLTRPFKQWLPMPFMGGRTRRSSLALPLVSA